MEGDEGEAGRDGGSAMDGGEGEVVLRGAEAMTGWDLAAFGWGGNAGFALFPINAALDGSFSIINFCSRTELSTVSM